MKDFEKKVAVITGAASGIGFGMAERCAREGMHVVMADIEEQALQVSKKQLEENGASVISVVTDVAQEDQIETLAQQAMERFGGVHLLVNNAGVGAGQTLWKATVADWQWTMGVNLWGTIHGIRTFIPLMLEQDADCHIVNVASIEGLWSRATAGIYQVTKHAVVSLSEVLYYQLKLEKSRIGVSVLCPGGVDTNILDSWRNRPESMQNPPESIPKYTPQMEERMVQMRQAFKEGMKPLEVADYIFKAVKKDKFYIFTHPELKKYVKKRMKNILKEKNPKSPFPEREATLWAEYRKMMNLNPNS
jgi:NAD(P)-dependent dehydrogenase (short-subunit alcohol dehydrogenase family)